MKIKARKSEEMFSVAVSLNHSLLYNGNGNKPTGE
jgi:hypothetical protein